MFGVCWELMGYFHSLSLILMFWFSLSDGMVDGPVQTGPTDMVDGHRAYRPGILLFLDLEHAQQSSGRLRRCFQINYPRSSPIIGMRHCMEPAP